MFISPSCCDKRTVRYPGAEINSPKYGRNYTTDLDRTTRSVHRSRSPALSKMIGSMSRGPSAWRAQVKPPSSAAIDSYSAGCLLARRAIQVTPTTTSREPRLHGNHVAICLHFRDGRVSRRRSGCNSRMACGPPASGKMVIGVQTLNIIHDVGPCRTKITRDRLPEANRLIPIQTSAPDLDRCKSSRMLTWSGLEAHPARCSRRQILAPRVRG